jgi:hypothetical protein
MSRLIIYAIVPSSDPNGKPFWNRCGVAFKNNDGSLNLKLDLLPTTDLQVRKEVPREERDNDDDGSNRSRGRNAGRGR